MAGKQIRGGERRRSGNSSGAVDGCDSGAAAMRRRTAWSEWFWYGARRRRCRGGSSASALATKSLRALWLRLRWTTTSGYRLRRDGGRRWIGCYGVEDGGGWGFAAGGEGVFAPMEYEWGNGGRRGTKGGQFFGMRRACLKFGESYKLCPHLKFQTYCGLGVGR